MKIKRFAAVLAASALAATGLVTVQTNYQPAEAYTYRPWTVQCNSSRGLRAYDHIDQYGNPYGTSELRYACQTFSRNTDWDMVTWAGKYACLRYKLNDSPWRTDCNDKGHHKVTTDQRLLVYTVER